MIFLTLWHLQLCSYHTLIQHQLSCGWKYSANLPHCGNSPNGIDESSRTDETERGSTDRLTGLSIHSAERRQREWDKATAKTSREQGDRKPTSSGISDIVFDHSESTLFIRSLPISSLDLPFPRFLSMGVRSHFCCFGRMFSTRSRFDYILILGELSKCPWQKA